MKERRILRVVYMLFLCFLSVTAAVLLTGCFGENDPTGTTYTVRYRDSEFESPLLVTLDRGGALSRIPTRRGYAFAGLYETASGGTQFFDDEGLLCISSAKNLPDHELYTRWIPLECTFRFDTGIGEVDTEEFVVSYGATIPAFPVPTATGYEFVGWFLDDGTQCSEEESPCPGYTAFTYTAYKTTEESVTLVAHYTRAMCEVLLVFDD